MEIEPIELSRYRKISCDEAIKTFSTNLVRERCFALPTTDDPPHRHHKGRFSCRSTYTVASSLPLDRLTRRIPAPLR
jgi:hypothetical protein